MDRGKLSVILKTGIVLLSIVVYGQAHAKNNYDLSILAGQKSLADSYWGPIDKQNEYGLGFEIHSSEVQVSTVFSYTYATADKTETDAKTQIKEKASGDISELGVGARGYLLDGVAKLYLDGGVSALIARIKRTQSGTSETDSDRTLGLWYGIGLDAEVRQGIRLGIHARSSSGGVRLLGVSGQAGGEHLKGYISIGF